MNLAAYQRAVLERAFALESEPVLPGFELYRQLIRARFSSMAQVAFRRSWLLLGERACAESFARFLASHRPRSPILREVIASFGDFALDDRALLAGAAAWAPDLLRFEASVWRVASADDRSLGELRDVDFEGVLVFNPTLVQLALQHDVSEPTRESVTLSHTLLVYRRRGQDQVHWYRAPALLRELLALAGEQERPLGELVRTLFAQRSAAEGEALLEELAAALTTAVERDVLWGVRGGAAPGGPSRLDQA
ncbi:MAG: hypothetical protein JWN48_3749 [Myxococcaceae bacterium]|nr:hypothetical protein [Myxococcaceae bacterium]